MTGAVGGRCVTGKVSAHSVTGITSGRCVGGVQYVQSSNGHGGDLGEKAELKRFPESRALETAGLSEGHKRGRGALNTPLVLWLLCDANQS